MLSEQCETGLEDELVELHLEREQATTSSPGYRPKRPGNPLATELVTSRDVPHGPKAQAAFKPCPSDSDTKKEMAAPVPRSSHQGSNFLRGMVWYPRGPKGGGVWS